MFWNPFVDLVLSQFRDVEGFGATFEIIDVDMYSLP